MAMMRKIVNLRRLFIKDLDPLFIKLLPFTRLELRFESTSVEVNFYLTANDFETSRKTFQGFSAY
jgi:hypothetical protein